MKWNNSVFGFFALVIVLLFSSCEKGAGPGGKAKINVTVMNGNMLVGGATVKLRYGGTAYSPNIPYDETQISDYTGDVTFDDLRRGDYYVYATIADTSGTTLEGGAHVLINNKPGETHVVVDFAEADPF